MFDSGVIPWRKPSNIATHHYSENSIWRALTILNSEIPPSSWVIFKHTHLSFQNAKYWAYISLELKMQDCFGKKEWVQFTKSFSWLPSWIFDCHHFFLPWTKSPSSDNTFRGIAHWNTMFINELGFVDWIQDGGHRHLGLRDPTLIVA